jgi:hypothetical protein
MVVLAVFRGVARVYNVSHATDPDDWGMYVTEKPRDEHEEPTHTPGGMSLAEHPMIPLRPDGTIDTSPTKSMNETHELILHKYGPRLVKKLHEQVQAAIEGLRQYLGEYRSLPEAEADAAERRADAVREEHTDVEACRATTVETNAHARTAEVSQPVPVPVR